MTFRIFAGRRSNSFFSDNFIYMNFKEERYSESNSDSENDRKYNELRKSYRNALIAKNKINKRYNTLEKENKITNRNYNNLKEDYNDLRASFNNNIKKYNNIIIY